jgi:hypothetical protein
VLRRLPILASLLIAIPLVNTQIDAQGGSSITPASWNWIGPGNIGGHVRALAFDPSSSTTLFAGAPGGGIWKTTTAGTTWTPIADGLASMVVTSLVFRPGSPLTAYAGTGEGFTAVDSLQGAGILKSIDGGTSWAALGSTGGADFRFVNHLAMSANGAILLAATNAGLFRSTDQGGSFLPVLTATGVGWTELMDVKFLPGSSTNAVATGNSSNAYFSTDGGATWNPATGLTLQTTNAAQPERVEIGVSPAAPGTAYLHVNVNGGEVWRSTNGGASYTKMGTTGATQGYGAYALSIWVDPTNPNIIVVGSHEMARSVDAGVTWERISSAPNAPALSISGQQHIIVHDPGFNGTTNRRVFIATDGGVWRADDIYEARHLICAGCHSIDFVSLNHNLGVTNFYGGAGDPVTGKIVGGSQSNGTLVYTPANGPQGWTVEFGDDAGYAAIDPSDPNYLYGSYAYLRLQRSTDGGATGFMIYGSSPAGTCKAAPYRIDDACNGTANYVAPFMLDPGNPNRMLAGGVSLWQSNDIKAPLTSTTGPSWRAIKPATGGNSPISALTIAAGNPNLVWVGHNNGDVYVTGDSTAVTPTWNKVDGGSLPDRTVTSIAIDPRDWNTAYATFDGFNADNVWKTTNGGSTWTPLYGLPTIPAYTVVVHPTLSRIVFVGTANGVFQSNDGGANWLPSIGPGNMAVRQLFWMGSRLVAVTHGRGMFTVLAGGSISASPSSVLINGTVNVTVTDGGGGASDYVGLYRVGAPEGSDLSRQYMYGQTSLTLAFTMPSISGDYELRLVNGDYNDVAARSNPVTVTCPTASPSAGWVCVSGTWKPRDRGDFTGDTRADLIWQHPSTGAVLLWEMNGSTYVSGTILNAGGTEWQIVGAGDFSLDGKPDLLWQHPSTGAVLLWQMDGTTYNGGAILNSGGTLWKVVGVGDFNGDGKLDLLWQHPSTGAVLVWFMNGPTYPGGVVINSGGTLWKVVGAGDFTGDGKPDILWQHPQTGGVLLWQMDGTTYVGGSILNEGGTLWQVSAVGDYTGDGKPDIIWQHPCTGAVLLWQMNGAAYAGGAVINSGGTLWKIMAPR